VEDPLLLVETDQREATLQHIDCDLVRINSADKHHQLYSLEIDSLIKVIIMA
jgi:hypothetical protein